MKLRFFFAVSVAVLLTASARGALTNSFSLFSDAVGNNNGGIDPNECISLNVVLQNTGATTASNIVATLSTTNGGVTISQPLSTYPNAAAGASRTNTTPFQLSTSPSFFCGAPIDLVLTATYSGGTNALPIHLNTGSGIGTAIRFDPTDTPVPISFVLGGLSSNIVSGITSSVAKVTVSVYITSDSNSDMDLYLIGPDSTFVSLATSGGGAFGAGYGTNCTPDANRTIFDDGAATSIYSGTPPFIGSYKPEQTLSAFTGKSGSAVNGTWYLLVGNFLATAQLECWSLNISPATCSSGTGVCAADSVGDGIPDSWRLQYFVGGIPTNASSCAACDPDGDGKSNLQEFLSGTDPTNNASAFRITSIARAGTNVLVTWMIGSGKTNALQATAGVGNGNYATNNFSDIFTVTNTIGPVTNYLEIGTATNFPSRFYRVRLVP